MRSAACFYNEIILRNELKPRPDQPGLFCFVVCHLVNLPGTPQKAKARRSSRASLSYTPEKQASELRHACSKISYEAIRGPRSPSTGHQVAKPNLRLARNQELSRNCRRLLPLSQRRTRMAPDMAQTDFRISRVSAQDWTMRHCVKPSSQRAPEQTSQNLRPGEFPLKLFAHFASSPRSPDLYTGRLFYAARPFDLHSTA